MIHTVQHPPALEERILAVCVSQLNLLDEVARDRVLRYLLDRFVPLPPEALVKSPVKPDEPLCAR